MVDQDFSSGHAESSEPKIELKVKTLDSKIHSFSVDKNMTVLSFKENIVKETGIPVEQQRLIFKGKVLKDGDRLSAYNVENGDALHLVVRKSPPAEAQLGSSSGANDSNRENNTAGGGPRHRIGLSHSVVLGTFNVGDQGEGVVPDIGRVIGSVLNSIGIGGNASITSNGTDVQVNVSNQTLNEADDGARVGQHQVRNQSGPREVPPFSLPQVQIPLVGSFAPSIYQPIPDCLSTLSEYIDRMNASFANNGYRPDLTLRLSSGTAEFASNIAPPSYADLRDVIHHAERLLSEHIIRALSHISQRLVQVATETDAAIRGQIQNESMEVGLAMHHLGALFLELGRAIQAIHVGQSPAELFVNAGPALYLSPSGPNPMMVQPSVFQSSPIFPPTGFQMMNPGFFPPTGAATTGNAARHVNIHIHAGGPVGATAGSRTNNSGATDDAHTSANESGHPHEQTATTFSFPVATAVPTDGQTVTTEIVANGYDEVVNASLPPTSEDIKDVPPPDSMNGRNEEIVVSMMVDPAQPTYSDAPPLSSSERQHSGQPSDASNPDQDVKPATFTTHPLGLGHAGLQPRRRNRQSKAQNGSGDGGSSDISQSQRCGQEVLRAIASRFAPNVSNHQSGQPQQSSASGAPQNVGGVQSVMSQVLHSPALNGLLEGVSEQAGIRSPDVLKNMLQQFTQSPQMQNAVSHIAEQVGNQSGIGMGEGRAEGIDLSRMLQQVLPMVSRALGSSPIIDQSGGDTETRSTVGQGNIEQLVQDLEHTQEPGEIFRGVAECALQQSAENANVEGVTDLLCDDTLVREYVEILRRDIEQRVNRISGSEEK